MILAVALTAIVPFALAWYYAQHPEFIEKTSNYGTLIVPPRTLDYAALFAQPAFPAESWSDIKGRWVLLHVASGPCGPACAETLYKTHQARLMLNKEIPRVKRLLLVPPGTPAEETDALLKKDDALAITAAPAPLLKTVAEALGRPPTENMVILLDPLGNTVLWYDGGFDPYGLVKDLKHLLKASQIG